MDKPNFCLICLIYQISVIKSKDYANRIDKSLANIIPKNKRESYDIMPIIKLFLIKKHF